MLKEIISSNIYTPQVFEAAIGKPIEMEVSNLYQITNQIFSQVSFITKVDFWPVQSIVDEIITKSKLSSNDPSYKIGFQVWNNPNALTSYLLQRVYSGSQEDINGEILLRKILTTNYEVGKIGSDIKNVIGKVIDFFDLGLLQEWKDKETVLCVVTPSGFEPEFTG